MENCYDAFGAFICRTPSLPLTFLPRFKPTQYSKDFFLELLKHSLFRESIYLSSSQLYDECTKYETSSEQERDPKLEFTLLKYLLRITTRATPFATFAGCQIGSITSETDDLKLEIENWKNSIRIARLDMEYLNNVICYLENELEIRPFLKYNVNNTLYRIGSQFRYVKTTKIHKLNSNELVTIETSPYLEKIIESADGKKIDELSELLLSKEVTIKESKEFIHELIEERILISNLNITLTGEDYSHNLMRMLKDLSKGITETKIRNRVEEIYLSLKEIQKRFDFIKENSLESYISVYEEIRCIIRKLEIKFDPQCLIQVDLKSAGECQIDGQTVRNLRSALSALSKLSTRTPSARIDLFKKKFVDRYEDEEVPLVEVFDSERGIDYPIMDRAICELLEGLEVGHHKVEDKVLWHDKIHTYWSKKFEDALKKNNRVIEVADNEIIAFESKHELLPETLSVICSMNDNRLKIISIGGLTATSMISRIGHMDSKIEALLSNISNKESEINSNKIIAAIVHLPQDRVGNVIRRPQFRDFEIPYLAGSSLKKENQIPITDLMISIKNGRIILRSKKWNLEVIPRLDNAHAYWQNNLPIYSFLCELQNPQKISDIKLDFGVLWKVYSFFPRIVYKNIILSSAMWKLRLPEKVSGKSYPEISKFFLAFKAEHNVPRFINLIDGEDELILDTEDVVQLKLMFEIWQKKRELLISESFFCDWDPNSKAIYVNQLVVPFYKKQIEIVKASERPLFFNQQINNTVKRTFTVGDDWIYFKIYLGAESADELLAMGILPMVQKMKAIDIVEKFHFLRFRDRNFHIRLRLKLKDKRHYQDIISMFHSVIQKYMDEKIIYNIQIDTYKRELERYGYNTIDCVESVFDIDSMTTLHMIAHDNNRFGSFTSRTFATIYSLDSLLNSFGIAKADEKMRLMNALQNEFHKDFKFGKHLKIQLDKKFRNMREDIKTVLESDSEGSSLLCDKHLDLIRLRESAIANVMKDLTVEDRSTLFSKIGSFIHIHIFRIIKDRFHFHELTIYYILFKYYKEVISRSNNRNF